MSARYDTVVAMLDNDANFACVLRELCRRGELESPRQLVLPPQEGASGSVCYMSFRWHLQPHFDVDQASRDDILAEVWKEDDGSPHLRESWWVTLQDGNEIGPFPDKKSASGEAHRLLVRQGWQVLGDSPWDTKDEKKFPITYR
jgi:hypothetical protein